MPSAPRRVRGRVKVRHPRYGVKTVDRSRLYQLSRNWERVAEPKRRRRSTPKPPTPASEPSAPPSTVPDPDRPDSDKE